MILEKPVLVQDAGIDWTQVNTDFTSENVFVTSTGRLIAIARNTDKLYYSDDNGNIWQFLASKSFGTICTTLTGRLLAADVARGVWYSDDDGEMWSEIPIAGTYKYFDTFCVLPTGRIIAGGCTRYSGNSRGIWYSDDNGLNWVKSDTDSTYFDCTHICLTSTGRLLAGADSNMGVWYSDDDGETWTNLSNSPSRALYSLCVTNTGRIIVSTYNGNNDTATGMKYSDDNGETWSDLHADSYTRVQVSPTGRIFSCRAGTVYYSDDNGTTLNEGDSFNSIYSLNVLPTGKVIIGDTDSIYYSDPVYTMRDTYMSKPLTGAQAKELVQQCKAYVQALKNGN